MTKVRYALLLLGMITLPMLFVRAVHQLPPTIEYAAQCTNHVMSSRDWVRNYDKSARMLRKCGATVERNDKQIIVSIYASGIHITRFWTLDGVFVKAVTCRD